MIIGAWKQLEKMLLYLLDSKYFWNATEYATIKKLFRRNRRIEGEKLD